MHTHIREKIKQIKFHGFYFRVSPFVTLPKIKEGNIEIYILTHGLWATRPSPSSQPDSHHIL